MKNQIPTPPSTKPITYDYILANPGVYIPSRNGVKYSEQRLITLTGEPGRRCTIFVNPSVIQPASNNWSDKSFTFVKTDETFHMVIEK